MTRAPTTDGVEVAAGSRAMISRAEEITHDFNNMLAAINAHITLIGDATVGASEIQGHLDRMRRAAKRAGELFESLLAEEDLLDEETYDPTEGQ